MMFSPGDRIRYECTGDDGLPLVRYGFVGGIAGSGGPLVIMLDGELAGDVVNLAEVQPVTVTTVELVLHGADLIDDPELRRGLVSMWMAEADSAGLDIDSLHPMGDGECAPGGWCLADLRTAGERYVLRAVQLPTETDIVRVRAESPW